MSRIKAIEAFVARAHREPSNLEECVASAAMSGVQGNLIGCVAYDVASMLGISVNGINEAIRKHQDRKLRPSPEASWSRFKRKFSDAAIKRLIQRRLKHGGPLYIWRQGMWVDDCLQGIHVRMLDELPQAFIIGSGQLVAALPGIKGNVFVSIQGVCDASQNRSSLEI